MNWNYTQQPWFVYDPEGDGMQYFDSYDDARQAADAAVSEYFDEIDGTWDTELVTAVTMGRVTHSAMAVNVTERPPADEIDETGHDEAGNWWHDDWQQMCDYKICELKPD